MFIYRIKMNIYLYTAEILRNPDLGCGLRSTVWSSSFMYFD